MVIRFNPLIVCLLFLPMIVYSQNIGVGTTLPQYKVDVDGRMRLKTNLESSFLYLDGPALPYSATIGNINDGYFGITREVGAGWTLSYNVLNGNVGIGTPTPAFRLDVAGRMRIQQDTSTAGIWFDGPTLSKRSFFGTLDNDYVGFFGNGGAGWKFVMNVNNGNVGAGTASPTAKLDINGNIRIRAINTPGKGDVLTSLNSAGDAIWAKKEAFKVNGPINGVPFDINTLTWTKVLFNQTTTYNSGTGYNASNSEYVAPVNGIYHFNSTISFAAEIEKMSIRIRLNRNGVISTIAEIFEKDYLTYNGNVYFNADFLHPATISTETELLAGDKVWVEAYVAMESGTTNQIEINPIKSWFSGKILFRK